MRCCLLVACMPWFMRCLCVSMRPPLVADCCPACVRTAPRVTNHARAMPPRARQVLLRRAPLHHGKPGNEAPHMLATPGNFPHPCLPASMRPLLRSCWSVRTGSSIAWHATVRIGTSRVQSRTGERWVGACNAPAMRFRCWHSSHQTQNAHEACWSCCRMWPNARFGPHGTSAAAQLPATCVPAATG